MKNPRGKIKIEMRLVLGAIAEIVHRSTNPENEYPLHELRIRQETKKETIVFLVEGPLERIASIRRTIDDAIFSICLAIRTTRSVGEYRQKQNCS